MATIEFVPARSFSTPISTIVVVVVAAAAVDVAGATIADGAIFPWSVTHCAVDDTLKTLPWVTEFWDVVVAWTEQWIGVPGD